MSVPTYSQWLENEKTRLLEQKTADEEYAKKKKQREEEAAASELSRQTVQANNEFERSKVTYGAAAERLAQAGLTGSGYSDNLTRDAYAAKANALTAANVTYGAAMKQADDQYRDARYFADKGHRESLSSLEGNAVTYGQQQANSYAQELANVKNGYYTPSEIAQIAADRGYSPEQKQSLVDAANTYHRDTTLSDFKSKVASGNFDPASIEAAVADGRISETDRNAMKNEFTNALDTGATAFRTTDAEGNEVQMSRAEAEKMVEEYESHSWIDDPQKQAIRAAFNSLYTANVLATYDGDRKLENDGRNFNIWKDGEKYKLQSDGVVTDEDVIRAAANLDDKTIFQYANGQYIKYGGKIIRVEMRKGESLW